MRVQPRSVALFVIGAILAFAVHGSTSGIDVRFGAATNLPSSPYVHA